MNQRVPTPVSVGARRRWLFLYLLLPGLTDTAHPTIAKRSDKEAAANGRTRPYLSLACAPPLRFQDVVPPPDLSTRPPAGDPPKPDEPAAEDVIPPKQPEDEVVSAAAPAPASIPSPAKPTAAAGEPPPPPPILPDDARNRAKPEDFLPFFQYPGSEAGPDGLLVPPLPPIPGTVPPSTATYHQQ